MLPGLTTLLAVSILTGSQPIDHSLFTLTHEPLRKLALQMELLDPGEKHLLVLEMNFPREAHSLRCLHAELANAPRLADGGRFPCHALTRDCLHFNRAYQYHVTTRQAADMNHWGYWQCVLYEANQLHRVWEALDDGNNPAYYIEVRRQSLARLRDLLGDDAYHAGWLPPPVPLWRFAR